MPHLTAFKYFLGNKSNSEVVQDVLTWKVLQNIIVYVALRAIKQLYNDPIVQWENTTLTG